MAGRIQVHTIPVALACAAANRHTVIIIALEKDGSSEEREAEPYSLKEKNGKWLFFCYDVRKRGTRSFYLDNILSVRETDHTFTPQFPIEF